MDRRMEGRWRRCFWAGEKGWLFCVIGETESSRDGAVGMAPAYFRRSNQGWENDVRSNRAVSRHGKHQLPRYVSRCSTSRTRSLSSFEALTTKQKQLPATAENAQHKKPKLPNTLPWVFYSSGIC